MACLPYLNADVTGMCATHLEHALAECQAHTGGKEQIVGLEAGQRVAEVAVAVGNLPSEPALQLGGSGGVELEAVGAGLRNVGIKAEHLGDRGAVIDLSVKAFA